MSGTCTALLTFQTASTPTGSNPGPLTPPVPKPSAGFLRSTSITRPGIVFTSVIPSAPASTAALAVSAIADRVGESLTEERLARRRAGPLNQRRQNVAIGSEFHAASFRIRTAHVELERIDARFIRKPLDDSREIFEHASDNVHHHTRITHMLSEPRKILALHCV